MVLTSGAASLVGFPSYFSFLPFTDQKLKSEFNKSTKKACDLTSGQTRRAQSMSVLPRVEKDVFEADPDFDDFEKECADIEAHRSGLLLQMSFASPEERHNDTRYPGISRASKLPPTASRTQTRHPIQKRRVKSAPCVGLSLVPPALLDELDTWDTDDFTLNEEWVVPAIKAKAEQKQNQKQDPVEAWDVDFDEEDDIIEIPAHMQTAQSKFKADILHMRKFALHMEGNHD